MGLFDKLKKKAEESLGQAGSQASQPSQPSQAAPVAEAQAAPEEDMGMSYEPTEWAFYYRQPDNWGGINWNDLDEFMLRYFTIEEAQGEGEGDQALAKYGYKGRQEWAHIQCTFFRYYFGRGGQVPVGDVEVNMGDPAWMQAGMNARNKQGMAMRAAAAQANPELTAPVEGVTVEQWAAASAKMASCGNDAAAMNKALAQLNLDMAKYNRINMAFQQKMQGDTTGVIATIFGQAFSQAQGVSGGWGLGTVDGSAQKLGEAPVTFDKYAEINGAMSAWAQQGADVNAKLQAVFGINAAELSKYGSYWATKMQADVQLMTQYCELTDKYTAQYAGPGFDDDLDKI